MESPIVASLARDVDRLVVAVHRTAGRVHGATIRQAVEPLGLEEPGHLVDVAEFIAHGRLTPDVMELRFRYDPHSAVAADGAVIESHGGMNGRRPSAPLEDAVSVILGTRASVAARLWPSRLDTELRGAEEAVAAATGALTDHFVRLPPPDEPAHRLHHLLTALRYVRMDAHEVAWRAEGLDREQILALTAAWQHPPEPAVPAELLQRGLLDVDGRITDTGRQVRHRIEDATNRGCAAVFDAIDDLGRWRRLLADLASE